MPTPTNIAAKRRQSGSSPAPGKANPPRPEDVREHHRYAVAETLIRVTWLDANGDVKTESGARPINVSERGMAVQIPEAALLLSRVRLESDNGELLGHGKVRYCRPAGENFIVGIEFTDSLCWTAPTGPINEPIPLYPPRGDGDDQSDASSGAVVRPLEDLLWSEEADGGRPASSPSAGTFTAPAPELHLSLDSRADQGFFARIPMAVKAGAVVMALALGSFLLGHGNTASDAVAGDKSASVVGEQGWVTEWASDAVGSRRGRQITLYRPSKFLSDYQMQFSGQIENQALGWVFRAADTKNYYGMKIENDKPGSVKYTRFAVVGGRESSVTEKLLPIQARADTSYNVKLEVNGPHFSVYVQGEPVELWTDNRLKTGALGFMNESQESGRTSSVRFSFQNASGN